MAIYVKTKFLVSVAKSETFCKQLEFLALNIEVSNGSLYNCDWLL